MSSHHPETIRLMETSESPEGVNRRAATSTSLLSAHNTNSNANSDIAGVALRGAVTERLSGNGILLNQLPVSSGQSSPCSTSDVSSPGSAANLAEGSLQTMAFPHASPIACAGDLPPNAVIPNITSPLLGFEPSNEHTHSPNAPSSAQYHPKPENQGISVSARIAISPTTSSPSLFPQNIILDPRSHLGLPRGSIILPQNLTASIPLEDSEPQVCLWDNCGVEFPNLHSLVSHLDRGHTLSMVKYICLWKDCPRNLKPFDARYKLITHLRCHTGEKPYVCDIAGCSRAFSRLENLKLHVRTHTGEKPYVCHYENCNKRFNNTSDRAKHMKTHVTRKPYACKYPGCSKCYTDPSSMRKHVKFAHRLSGTSGNGTSQRSSRKLSTASSTGSSTPSTPCTPTAGLAMVVQRPTAPLAISPMGTVLPTRFAQPICIQSSSSGNHNIMPSVVGTSITTTSIPPPLLPVPTFLQPGGAPQSINQPVSVIQPSVQVQYMQTGNPQQPLVMLVPSTGNANGVNCGIRDQPPKVVSLPSGIQLQRIVSPSSTTRTSMQQTSTSQQLPAFEQPVSYVYGTRLEQSQSGLQPPESRDHTHLGDTQNEKPSSVESQLRQQIAELKEQLLLSKQAQGLKPSITTTSISNSQPVCMIQPAHGLRQTVSPVQGSSPTKVANAVVGILQPSQNPHSHMQGQMVALQPPLAIQSPSMIPTQLIQPTPLHMPSNQNLASPARQLTLVNPTQILSVTPRQNGPCIIPHAQFMVPGTQVMPFIQSQGVTPQIVHLAPLSNET